MKAYRFTVAASLIVLAAHALENSYATGLLGSLLN